MLDAVRTVQRYDRQKRSAWRDRTREMPVPIDIDCALSISICVCAIPNCTDYKTRAIAGVLISTRKQHAIRNWQVPQPWGRRANRFEAISSG